jgi:hypothetical protein
MMSSFSKMAKVTASTKRRPVVSGGKMAESWTTQIASLKCTPLDPVDSETARRLNVATAYEIKECFVDSGLDIIQGDKLVVGAKEYPIREVEPWEWRGSHYQRLLLDDLKK